MEFTFTSVTALIMVLSMLLACFAFFPAVAIFAAIHKRWVWALLCLIPPVSFLFALVDWPAAKKPMLAGFFLLFLSLALFVFRGFYLFDGNFNFSISTG